MSRHEEGVSGGAHKEEPAAGRDWWKKCRHLVLVRTPPSFTQVRVHAGVCWDPSCLHFSSAMHHFTLTPPQPPTPLAHTPTPRLHSHFPTSSFLLCHPSSPTTHSWRMGQSVSLCNPPTHPSLPYTPPHPLPPISLSLSVSVLFLSGEADRPHSRGRPRRPLLTRLSVTPPPSSLWTSLTATLPPPQPPTLTMYCFGWPSFYLTPLSVPSPSDASLLTPTLSFWPER